MRILIDECVDPRIKFLLGDHDVSTVHEVGWDALKDGSLLTLAQEQFDSFLTIDRGIEFQQNLAALHLSIVILHVPKNQMIYYRLLQPQLLLAVEAARPGKAVHVSVSI